MKKALYDILVFSADPVISESLESILFVINIRPKIIRDYSEIKEKITEKKAIYDHSVDQRDNKWNSQTKLNKIDLNKMPDYLRRNYKKYSDWLEL